MCISRATRPTMSLAALVNDSTTLQRLVQLGVSLATWEQRGYAGLAAKLDFAADVAPLVRLGRHIDGSRVDTQGLWPNWILQLMWRH
jgi:hypothetical protein